MNHKSPNKKILLFGGWFGSHNAGDEAILLGLKQLLERAVPGSTIHAHTIDPDYTRRVCGVEPVYAPSNTHMLGKAMALAGAYRSMDLVVVSGGTPIFDYRYLSRAFHFGIPILSGIPMAFVGIGLKPIRSAFGKWFYRQFLGRARFISVRDPEVGEHLRSMGVTSELHLTADSAICIARGDGREAEQILAAAGLEPASPMIGICPIYLSERYKEHYHEPVTEAHRSYAYRSLGAVADQLIATGRQVVFIPMHQVPPDDDREAIRQVVRHMSRGPVVLEPPEDPMVVTDLLARMNMVVGMRLHSLVLAASCAVPVVAIGFDMKVGGFMRYLGMEQYCRPISDFTAEQLIAIVEECWSQRPQVRQALMRRMTQWRGLIDGSIARVAELLR